MAHTESFETIANCSIRIMRKGSGEPLVFLHGAGGASVWLPFMEALSETYDVIVPEHPGFGASDTPDWLDNIGDLAFFYLDLIEHLGLKNVHLMGTSLGGWIAAELATRSCENIKSLTLVAPAGIHVKGVKKVDMFLLSPDDLPGKLFHDPEMAKSMPVPANEEETMAVLKNGLMTAKLGWSPRMHNPHMRKWLHRINCPTLIIWGENDELLPVAYGPAYQELIPNSKLEIIPECGHLPNIEKQTEFNAMVSKFLEGVA